MAHEVKERKPAPIYCDPCSLEDQQIEAEGYCEDCKHFLCAECCAFHRKPIPSRHHTVIKDIASVKQFENEKGIPYFSETCDTHTMEVIKFHCLKHDELGCGTCMMLSHRNCETVYIPDVANTAEFGIEQGKFITELNALEKDFSASLNKADLNIPNANRLFTDATKDFHSFKNGIENQLNTMEKYIEDRTSEIHDHDIQAMEHIAEVCKNYKKAIQMLLEKSPAGTKVGSKQYILIKRNGTTLKEWKCSLDEIQSDIGIQQYEFKPNIDPHTVGSLGKLVLFEGDSDDTRSDTTDGSDACMEEPTFEIQYDKQETEIRDLVAKSQSDFERLEISGIVLLSDNKLVIVDKGNQNVKLIDIKKNKVVDEIKVRYRIYNVWEPYGIAVVDGNQVAVTCPFRQKIQFIKVKKKMSEGSALKVSGRCYGIAYDNWQQFFVVTFSEPAKVEMIDKTGITLRVLLPVTDAQQLFEHPHYAILARDGKRLYVSDSKTSTVTRIDVDGDITRAFVYHPGSPFDPLGLTICNDGHVYVCDMSSDNIHCLTAECEFIQTVLDGKKRFPMCITYSEHDDMIYLSTILEKIVMFRIHHNQSAISK